MKKLYMLGSILSSVFITSESLALSYGICPSPDALTVSRVNDKYEVKVPSGYTYLGASTTITQTGPIAFGDTYLSSVGTVPSTMTAVQASRDIGCGYGIGSENADGTYPSGYIYLTVNNSKNQYFNLNGRSWIADGSDALCANVPGGQGDCSFYAQ